MSKISFSFLACFLLTFSAQAQIELVAMYSDGAVGTVSAMRWNAATGAVLDSVPTPETMIYAGSSVFDPTTGRYYFQSDNGLNLLDFAPDSFANMGAVPLTNSSELDMSNGRIYGVDTEAVYDSVGTYIGANLHLIRHSLTTGQDTIVGLVPNIWGVVMDASTFNSNTGEYYVVALDINNNYQIVSMSTRGAFTYSMVPITSTSQIFIGLEYDNEFNILYGMGYNTVAGANLLDIFKINPTTGVLTVETYLPQVLGFVSTTQTFDQTTSSVIFMGIDSLNNYNLYVYNTVQNTMSIGMVPSLYPIEIEADNSLFAFNKYLATDAAEPVASTVRIYPHPVQDAFQIDAASPLVGFTLYDLSGRIVHQGQGGAITPVDCADLPTGLYLLEGQLADGMRFRSRIVKE